MPSRFRPHPNPTPKGLFVRLTRLVLALACFLVCLFTLLHYGSLSMGGRARAALLTMGLALMTWKMDKILPLPD
jgi:hypothetical protein